MKGKKQRLIRAGNAKKKGPSDVSPSTSLPPLVEGQLRCFLRVTISRVLWTVHKPPAATLVRLRWWGESSNGTHFFLRDGPQLSQKPIETTARFPIRCGPKQFTSYLTDMGSLVLEVLTKPDHLPVARAQVAGISSLSMSHPISGCYTLVSPTSEKLGELQVSLNVDPLPEAYDSCSSGPTTDFGVEGQQATRSLSAGSGKESIGSSSGNTPRGKDYLYFQSGRNDKGVVRSLENQMPITSKSQNIKPTVNHSTPEPSGQTSGDILSVLLERGDKLRNAMVESALKCDVDSAPVLKDTPFPLPKDNSLPPSKPLSSPFGMFLENILHADSSVKHSDAAVVSESGLDGPTDMDSRAVDLLLGSTSPLPPWNGEVSSPGSLSGHSSVCGDSDVADPQYDQSLLENLFYKTPASDTKSEDIDVEGQETMYSCKNQPKQFSREASEPKSPAKACGTPPGLSAEQLTVLRSVRQVRVTIDSLTLLTGTTPRKAFSKGKPPRPLTSKKCTYIVECVIPALSLHDYSNAGDAEVTRAVSSKVIGGVVKFHKLSVFPLHFSPATLETWWETDLTFQIYSQKSDQKKPVPIGKAVHPLQSLLQSKELCQSLTLPVQKPQGNSETQEVEHVKVSLELTTDSKNGKHNVAWRDGSQTAPSPQRESGSRSQCFHTGTQEFPAHSDSRLNVGSSQKPSDEPVSPPSLRTYPHVAWQQVEEDTDLLLHTIVMVPDGRNFTCGPTQAPNVYLNFKLFWCSETARSAVSWGQANPVFSFVQVTPVALTTKLLERMKNNVMVIEVWQKLGGSGQDKLLGLVKLPLNQFYMSFRDPKIAQLLLQAHYPVLGVDSYMPVIDVFSGNCKGNLRVVLAMGRSEQIAALQRTRAEEHESLSHLVRPVHMLDYQAHSQTRMFAAHKEIMTEHLFVIRLEKINGLTPLQSTVWGEADCYVQYSFPCQEADPAAKADEDLIEGVNLKPFRSTTTLCVPDPVLGHTETHVLLLPEGVPVQKLLLSSLSSQGLSSGGGIPFEVWCRYYYPNVRDQLVAKGLLPLSKLCAVVTMQRQHPDEAQMFSLPLIPKVDSPTGHQLQPSGLLDVCVRYKHRPVRPEGLSGRGAASRVVTLLVQVHRASGLQAAARVNSNQDERFSYFASVGVNAYVTLELSFLPENERRCTHVAEKTFCPEFNHQMEVSCGLLIQKGRGETCSLAEQLVEASAVFTLWNVDSRKAINLSSPKDVMLGSVKIPLADLIHKATGISGWFGVSAPQETGSSQHHILVGGLELSISFAHHSDRERVIKAAQGLGWEMAKRDHAIHDDDEAWEERSRKLFLTFSMPRAWIPVHCLLLPGHHEVERSTYCYFRYKFYDEDAVCSHMRHPRVEEEGQAAVSFEGSRTVELRSTQPVMWYLREEKLEVEVWVAFTKNKTKRPSDKDRLVGSAFVDLSSLANVPKQKLTLSGVYPLFRHTAADLQGAALRVHVTLTAGAAPREMPDVCDTQVDSDSQGELLPEEVETSDRPPSPTTPNQSHAQSRHKNATSRTTSDITCVQHTEVSMEESFPVTVAVDQAMHLNLKGCPLAERSEGTPCCCVSYVTADSAEPVSTAVIANTDAPMWGHQHECRLSNQLLVDPQQSLVFKVWHKGEVERVLGFASVDLSPLLCGFPSVCGWYNITDFSGQCHGQLKVSITPLKGIQDLRGQRKTLNEEAAKNSSTLFQALPLSCHTTATYSSFPSHISRYPEQKVTSPDQTDALFSDGTSKSDRHFEHMDKVRLYHQNLQEQTVAHSFCGDLSPSSSFLFSALRKKLSELDNIQRYFSRKLSTPTFPSVAEDDRHTKHQEHREAETDISQLLLKSNQLVGEVNNIFGGIKGLHPATVSPNPQRRSSLVGEHSRHTIPERLSSPDSASNSSLDDVSPLPSLLPKMSENQMDSEPEEERDKQNSSLTLSEDDNEEGHDKETGRGQDEESEEEEDEDYDEVVVKQRHLNEVTSLTDKTSPWTSILTDPDLVSLESLEIPEEPDLSRNQHLKTFGSKHTRARQEESESFNGSAGDASDTEGDDERTRHVLDERQEEPSCSTDGSRDTCPSPNMQHVTDVSDDDSCSVDDQNSQLQPSVPVEVPNFFLPSQQLEASMRAIRLAPSFFQSSGESERGVSLQSLPPHRRPRQFPDMSPSSMKKETERISKIFSSNFDDAH